jgi:ketosteroid isomerase-like protein
MKQVLTPLILALFILTSCKNVGKKETQTGMVTETENSMTRLTLAAVEKFNLAFNRQDVDAVMTAMTEDCVYEDTYPQPDGTTRFEGANAVRAFWEKFFAAYPDALFETEEIFATGDRCVVRWIYRTTKEGKPWHLRGVDIFKVRNGKVAEKLAYVKG